jgi:hypothetical protein
MNRVGAATSHESDGSLLLLWFCRGNNSFGFIMVRYKKTGVTKKHNNKLALRE